MVWMIIDYCEKHTIADFVGGVFKFIISAMVGGIMIIFILAAYAGH